MHYKAKYHILTFGCQMNKNDSERIAGLLSSLGMKESIIPGDADILIMNTCSVRQHAEDRVYGIIREWQKFRKNKPNLFIGVTGCMPGRDRDGKLRKKIKGVDWFFPIKDLPMLPALFGRDAINRVSACDNYWQFSPKREENFRIFVAIQTGCNNFCSYCVVPYARGQEKNRHAKDILAEIRHAAVNGAKEVTLLGQVVNNYRAPDMKNFNFVDLLKKINKIRGVERINWTAADPQYFSDDLIQALTFPKQVNYLHLPVQSGDNEILKKMNRKYTREYYIELVKKIRKARPGIAIGTDIIVGFCGETEKQFKNTVDLYKRCDFDIAYLAQYSERPETIAAKMFRDDVFAVEKKRRWDILHDLMEATTLAKNQKYVGREVSVLVDKCGDGRCFGNSSEMKLVGFSGSKKLIGKIVDVKIEEAREWILRGKFRNLEILK